MGEGGGERCIGYGLRGEKEGAALPTLSMMNVSGRESMEKGLTEPREPIEVETYIMHDSCT